MKQYTKLLGRSGNAALREWRFVGGLSAGAFIIGLLVPDFWFALAVTAGGMLGPFIALMVLIENSNPRY